MVITTDPKYYDWPVDIENTDLIPGGVQIIRTPAFSAAWTRRIGVGDIGMRSLWHHWRALARLYREQRIDLLFISIPPYPTAILGRLAARVFGLPYVLDYIDPWRGELYLKLPSSQRPGGSKFLLSYAMARVLEPLALRDVSHLVAVSRGTTDIILEQYPWLKGVAASVIPYGGEPADFEYLSSHSQRNRIFDRDDGYIHVSYLGTCSAGMRSVIRALFTAVRLGLDRFPDRFTKLRLHFVGTTYAADAETRYQVLPVAEELGLHDTVTEHPGRIPYFEALQTLRDSHGLVVIGSEEPHYTASKLYPYIMARRPLLAVFHESSSVVDIMRETQAGEVVTFGDRGPIATRTEDLLTSLATMLDCGPDYVPETRWDAFERYTVRSMTARLAHVFDSVVSSTVNAAGADGPAADG